MERLYGLLAIAAFVLGGVEMLQYMERKLLVDLYYGALYISAGLSLLAVYEIIKVLKEIRDGKKPDQTLAPSD